MGTITEEGRLWTTIHSPDLDPRVRKLNHHFECRPVQSVLDKWRWSSLIQIFQCINHSVHLFWAPFLRRVRLGPPYTRSVGTLESGSKVISMIVDRSEACLARQDDRYLFKSATTVYSKKVYSYIGPHCWGGVALDHHTIGRCKL